MHIFWGIEERKPTASILYDVDNYAEEYMGLVWRLETELASKLLDRLIERNVGEGGVEGVVRVLEEAYGSLAPSILVSIKGYEKLGKHSWVRVPLTPLTTLATYTYTMPNDSGEVDERRVFIPPLLALLQAAKATRQAV